MTLLTDSLLTIPLSLQENSSSRRSVPRVTHRWEKRRLDPAVSRQQMSSNTADEASPPVMVVSSNNRQLARLQALLTRSGYQVLSAPSGTAALRLLERKSISLAMAQNVDDMRPEVLCERLRAKIDQRQTDEVPIILLAERFDPDEVVRCFDAGADDCVTGPHLEARVLLARIQTLMRSCRGRASREQITQEEQVCIGNVVIDPVKFRVLADGRPLELTRIQFYVFYMMARRPGWIFSHAQLRGTIARYGGNPDEKSVKSHISHLRRRLGPAAALIETVRGMGYRLCEPQ